MQPQLYVHKWVITAVVAGASETTFAKVRSLVCMGESSAGWRVQHYSSIMPLLLNVVQDWNGPYYRKLRAKAMECAGLISTSSLALS